MTGFNFLGVEKPIINRRDMFGDAGPMESLFGISDYDSLQRICCMAAELAAVSAVDGNQIRR